MRSIPDNLRGRVSTLHFFSSLSPSPVAAINHSPHSPHSFLSPSPLMRTLLHFISVPSFMIHSVVQDEARLAQRTLASRDATLVIRRTGRAGNTFSRGVEERKCESASTHKSIATARPFSVTDRTSPSRATWAGASLASVMQHHPENWTRIWSYVVQLFGERSYFILRIVLYATRKRVEAYHLFLNQLLHSDRYQRQR